MSAHDEILPIIPSADPADELRTRIDILSAELWENTVPRASVDRWLHNFDGSCIGKDEDQLCALHLLSNFNYFGLTEIRVLLKSMFRDLYRYPIIQQVRDRMGRTLDFDAIQIEWQKELSSTRFLGMGNPSESGSHLLYFFRQANNLHKDLFVHPHELVNGPLNDSKTAFVDPSISRLIFIDDVLGSGQQATQYSNTLVPTLKKIAAKSGINLEICYFVLFAKEAGQKVAEATNFDRVDSVHQIQNSELAFSTNSRIFVDPPQGISRHTSQQIAIHYGATLYPACPVGYRDGQLLIGFHHNTPDNTLPIIWCGGGTSKWHPIFKRYGKLG